MTTSSISAPDHSEPPHRLRVLGPLELVVSGQRVSLPRSKKTRALLAYLMLSPREHRREKLCELFWDITDDPRGALRWSLSQLRKVLGPLSEHLHADRSVVSFDATSVQIDALLLRHAVVRGVNTLSGEELESLARLPDGILLEGLDLPDFLDWSAWCAGEREKSRSEFCAIARELVQRKTTDVGTAILHAKRWVESDPFDLEANQSLLSLLRTAGRRQEAAQRLENAQRLFKEVGADALELRELSESVIPTKAEQKQKAPLPDAEDTNAHVENSPPPYIDTSVVPFVGRHHEITLMDQKLRLALRSERATVLLVTAEPGGGKTRLSERFESRILSADMEILRAKAFEAESGRPYGFWADALKIDLAGLASENSSELETREAFFSLVSQKLTAKKQRRSGVALIVDDFQWLDADSAALLHYVARSHEGEPFLLVLLARPGELGDNEACGRTLRGFRKELSFEEVELPPLSSAEVAELVASVGGTDAVHIHEASSGNPLYALELSRRQNVKAPAEANSLTELVRQRVDGLPSAAADLLRWAAVLGHRFDADLLESLSSLDQDGLFLALERLFDDGLLLSETEQGRRRYAFGHDVVREAIYSGLSGPRRSMMHRRIVQKLTTEMQTPKVAAAVALHAERSGESLLGVKACITAGQSALRVFANADAESFARKGLRLVEQLDPIDRVPLSLDLLHVQFSAKTPDREKEAERLRRLAEEALDFGLTHAARLGFQMLSFLRWETSSITAAHENIMQAERISRSGTPEERTAALSHAARCLVLLERNLSQAEAFVLEAENLVKRSGKESSAALFASGMIAAHRGESRTAELSFREAQRLARQHGERLMEFSALQHELMLQVDRGNIEGARALLPRLVEIGTKVREGVEAPASRGLSSLVAIIEGTPDQGEQLEEALEALRLLDAKYEQAYLLTRWALYEAEKGNDSSAVSLSQRALVVARQLGRPSEVALAECVLVKCGEAAQNHPNPRDPAKVGDLSARAKNMLKTAGLLS